MFNTFFANESALIAEEAYAAKFDADFPGWEDRERWGETLFSESDMAPVVAHDHVSDEDWNAFLEMSWVDPAERDLP